MDIWITTKVRSQHILKRGGCRDLPFIRRKKNLSRDSHAATFISFASRGLVRYEML